MRNKTAWCGHRRFTSLISWTEIDCGPSTAAGHTFLSSTQGAIGSRPPPGPRSRSQQLLQESRGPFPDLQDIRPGFRDENESGKGTCVCTRIPQWDSGFGKVRTSSRGPGARLPKHCAFSPAGRAVSASLVRHTAQSSLIKMTAPHGELFLERPLTHHKATKQEDVAGRPSHAQRGHPVHVGQDTGGSRRSQRCLSRWTSTEAIQAMSLQTYLL